MPKKNPSVGVVVGVIAGIFAIGAIIGGSIGLGSALLSKKECNEAACTPEHKCRNCKNNRRNFIDHGTGGALIGGAIALLF